MPAASSHGLVAWLEILPRDSIQHNVEAILTDTAQSRLQLVGVTAGVSNNDLPVIQSWKAIKDHLNLQQKSGLLLLAGTVHGKQSLAAPEGFNSLNNLALTVTQTSH